VNQVDPKQTTMIDTHIQQQPDNAARLAIERHSQKLVIAFVVTGLFFMLLPGTFLGMWNLIDISREYTAGGLDPAWIQAHGQAQIFGWVGSFMLGIWFYSLTKMQGTLNFLVRLGWGGVLLMDFGSYPPLGLWHHGLALENWASSLRSDGTGSILSIRPLLTSA
jgi:hypothetical protein